GIGCEKHRAAFGARTVVEVEQRVLRFTIAGDGTEVVQCQQFAAGDAAKRRRMIAHRGQRQILRAPTDRGRSRASCARGTWASLPGAGRLARGHQQVAAAAAAGAVQVDPWRAALDRERLHGGECGGIGACMEMFETLATRPAQRERQLRNHGAARSSGAGSTEVSTSPSLCTSTSTSAITGSSGPLSLYSSLMR